jgi:hypothetical protein
MFEQKSALGWPPEAGKPLLAKLYALQKSLQTKVVGLNQK